MNTISSFFLGGAISWINFLLLRKWALRLGSFQKPSFPFLLAMSSRYVFLGVGIFIILRGAWVERWAGLSGLFGMYVGLLVYEFVKLKKQGD